jgi:hypothetical protein
MERNTGQRKGDYITKDENPRRILWVHAKLINLLNNKHIYITLTESVSWLAIALALKL